MDYKQRFDIPQRLKKNSHIDKEQYEELYKQSIQENSSFWLEQSKRINWIKEPQVAQTGDYHNVDFKWFEDGQLNASYNCIDRHLEERAKETALIWAKDEAGEYEYISYQQLHDNVCQVANALKSLGVKKGERVCLYLPMIPELVYTMLACSRIGAIHSIVFAGFSAEALRERIIDAKAKVVVTANEGLRGGKTIALKEITDKAIEGADCVDKILVVERTSRSFQLNSRDILFKELVSSQETTCEPVLMNSEDPLFILYTSGSTGRPKGLLHTTGGYLTYASYTHECVFDYNPGEVYFCAADIGWITGHSYIVYGPLANGATSVLFESTPLYPDAGRYWQMIEDLKVNIFYTAPTALRALASHGDNWPDKYDLSSLKILGTVGEPINPEIWMWYFQVVGKQQCAVVDTWWQTETGGILISPLPGATETKPGSATKPLFGVSPILLEPEKGTFLEGNEQKGALCLEHSWPGQARTIYGDHKRFVETYFSQYPGYYFTGDGCYRDQDGYYWITGRIDDVINVSGHRLGTAEIEGAIMEGEMIAEVAVVGYPHEIKGQGIYAYVIIHDKEQKNIEEEVRNLVRNSIGRFAAPDIVHITQGLPKTRSGKVMRRILRKIACLEFDTLGDISTLADPGVVEQLIKQRKELKN